ncbi:RNA-binding protein 34-like [Haliotis rufescens]|uniref:RNA-binding protein 34-like n=1 Tax=Haliotis rufescens TaxID=6454 RepID=UPI00201F5F53|nr:RNA-binding protein 34-like [Haliotis rufescens]
MKQMADNKYFVGQVADLLGGKKIKSEPVTPQKTKLAALFDVKTKEKIDFKKKGKPTPEKKAKKLKRSKTIESVKTEIKTEKDVKQEKKASPSIEEKKPKEAGKKEKKKKKKKEKTKEEGFCPPDGIVHESLTENSEEPKKQKQKKRKKEDDSDEENETAPKKRRTKYKRDKTKDKRTVFIGNLPLDAKKAAIKALFAEYGTIQSVRYRCPPISDPKVSKKVTFIKKSFHPNRSNIVCYVCFEDETAAKKALKLNGHELNGYHLRVDVSSNNKKHNRDNSVYVGNLSYDIEENMMWSHFEPCGAIENVRIIRDRQTGLGKGFGYVLFADKSSVDLALQLNKTSLNGRNIRVSNCTTAQKKDSLKKHPVRQRLLKKAKKLGMKPTNLRPGEVRKPKDRSKKPRHRDRVKQAFAADPSSAPQVTSQPNNRKHIKFT